VQQLLASVADPVISPLVEVEFHCAVARRSRAAAVPPGVVQRVFAEFRRHLAEQRFDVVPITAAEYRVARDWIAGLATPLRVLDALHLAAAQAGGLSLITADQELARSAEYFGVPCRLIS
jgi:predicted nucleic acid-binding protein